MKSSTLLFGLFILSIFLLSGCSEISTNEHFENKEEIKIIDIVGSSKTQEIYNPNPIKVEITGSSNKITIKEHTDIREIEIVGSSNIIYLPEGSYPTIDETGSSNQILYY